MFTVGTFYDEMLCLHGEKAGCTENKEKGKSWYCKRISDPCHFNCTKDQVHLYDKGVKEFLATKQDRPKCCTITSTSVKNGVAEIPVVIGRRYAKMKVVTDMKKKSFGRPFFVCSKKHDPCNYFAWGDQTIAETPLCKHGNPSQLVRVKKEGPNKDRLFFSCMEKRGDQCKFFKWFYGPDTEDPLLPECIEH